MTKLRAAAAAALMLLVWSAATNADSYGPWNLTVQPGGGSAALPMAGGGDVSMRRDGNSLHVVVRGPRAGLASLCLGSESRIRILHASAAVGEAVYERDGARWLRRTNFDFKLRDGGTGPPTEADRQAYLTAMGWVANSSRTGDAPREFTVRLGDDAAFLGVTFLATSESMALSHWPASMHDDCRAVKVAQGFLPDTAAFDPASWHRISRVP
jgi:hypothetical protein